MVWSNTYTLLSGFASPVTGLMVVVKVITSPKLSAGGGATVAENQKYWVSKAPRLA